MKSCFGHPQQKDKDLVNFQLQPIGLLAAGAIALSLSGCTTASSPTRESAAPGAEVTASSDNSGEALQVVTTFLPITQFTTAVAGDRAIVTQLLPTNVGPHEYQAKPSDAQAIAEADVLVKNGLEMEIFLDDTIKNAGNPDLIIVDSSEGIATLATDDADAGHEHAEEQSENHTEEHAEDQAKEQDETHTDEHAKEHGEEPKEDAQGHQHGEFNPHIWLDPKRVIEQVENIRDGLIAADPEGEAEYTTNAAAFIADLEALDTEITEQLAPFSGQTFVVFHDFAPYFAESYGLDTETLVGIPEENPSPEDVKQVMETVRAEGLKMIMTEPQAGQESFTAIAKDLDISVSLFDPIETGDPEAINPGYYLLIMRQNTANLVASFKTSEQVGLPLWPSAFGTVTFPDVISRGLNPWP